MKEILEAIRAVGVLTVLLTAVLWPLITLWSINALFKLDIAYGFKNWLACTILIFTLQGALNISKKKI